MDSGLFTRKDDNRPINTLNDGTILGFIIFNDEMFPTPCRTKADAFVTSVDQTFYVVARCSPSYQHFDKKFITEVKLFPGVDSVFMIPVHDLVGPASWVPHMLDLQDREQGL